MRIIFLMVFFLTLSVYAGHNEESTTPASHENTKPPRLTIRRGLIQVGYQLTVKDNSIKFERAEQLRAQIATLKNQREQIEDDTERAALEKRIEVLREEFKKILDSYFD